MKRSVFIQDTVEDLIEKSVGTPKNFSGVLNGLGSIGAIILIKCQEMGCLTDSTPETCVNVSKAFPFLASHEAVIIGYALHAIVESA